MGLGKVVADLIEHGKAVGIDVTPVLTYDWIKELTQCKKKGLRSFTYWFHVIKNRLMKKQK